MEPFQPGLEPEPIWKAGDAGNDLMNRTTMPTYSMNWGGVRGIPEPMKLCERNKKQEKEKKQKTHAIHGFQNFSYSE